ncbi:TolC family protein [Rheinheimera sp. UJ51]|uniref:TolC family protein n=1 Tax=Rheinheimera sp. UJ51 TaxID=2892446 RepID=UPI001E326FED|nr:TolC family protein [Rheinheimera sp. UJ51]MCC5450719.1 TolC family protein [Rheinheimera sp. UJ51]
MKIKFQSLLCVKAWSMTGVFLLMSCTAFASMNENVFQTITLENAIKRTMANEPLLYEFSVKQQILKSDAKTAALKPAYSLGVEVENVLGTGEVSGIKEAEVTLTLSSVIELGYKLHARGQVIDAKRNQLAIQRQIVSLDLLAEVTRRYIDVLATQETLSAMQQAEQLANYAYQAVVKRVEAGASPLLEEKRAQASLAEARLNVVTVQQQLQSNIKSLSIMWGDTNPVFTGVYGQLYTLPTPTGSNEFNYLIGALSKSPHIAQFAQQSRVQDAQIRLTQASNSPDITWTAGVRRMNGIDELAFVAGASVPLFTNTRNLGEYEAQKARLDQIELQKQASERELYHRVNQAIDARNRALLEVNTLQNDVIPPLKEALGLVEAAYSDGRFSYLEWVTTRKELLSAQLALIQAAKIAHQRNADIEALTGIAMTKSTDDVVSNTNFIEQ